MSEAATTLREQLLKLSEEDRVTISERLWESLSDEKQELIDAADDDPEFQAELDGRSESVANGSAELMDPKDVFAKVREHLRRKRES